MTGAINPDDRLAPWKAKSNRDMTPREPNYLQDADSFKRRLLRKELLKKYRLLIIKLRDKDCDQEPKNFAFVMPYGPYKKKTLIKAAQKDPIFVEVFLKYSGFRFKSKVHGKVKKLVKENRLDQKLKEKYV